MEKLISNLVSSILQKWPDAEVMSISLHDENTFIHSNELIIHRNHEWFLTIHDCSSQRLEINCFQVISGRQMRSCENPITATGMKGYRCAGEYQIDTAGKAGRYLVSYTDMQNPDSPVSIRCSVKDLVEHIGICLQWI